MKTHLKKAMASATTKAQRQAAFKKVAHAWKSSHKGKKSGSKGKKGRKSGRKSHKKSGSKGKRKPSAYNLHMRAAMKKGMSFTEAAHSWKH
jgi:hypothetical protein